jgi:hypothetical protein
MTFGSKGSKPERGATMREINNNQNNLNFPKVEIKKDVTQPVEPVNAEETEQVQTTDNLSLAPEAIIGRSQVQMSGINKTNANIEADMKVMLDNPNAVKKAVDFFDVAYNHLKEKGSDEAYEKAAVLTNAFKDDFLN